MKARYINPLFVAVVLVTAFGCSTTFTQQDRQRPTHRWVADNGVSQARYNFDNTRCLDAAASASEGESTDRPELEMRQSAPEFQAYEQCMEQRGYRLATY